MIIKNANELTVDEKSRFREAYTRYFEETSVVSTNEEVNNNPLKSFLSSKSERYAIEMIRKIDIGDRTAVIGFSEVDKSVIGFIVGSITQKQNDISHFYCTGESFITKRQNERKLLSSFSLSAYGGKVLVRCDVSDENLNSTLNALGLKLVKTEEEQNEYCGIGL